MMKTIIGKKGVSLGVLACAAIAASPASAELVYESEISDGQTAAPVSQQEVQPGAASEPETSNRAEERELTRTTMKVAEKSLQSSGASNTFPAMTDEGSASQIRTVAPQSSEPVEVTSLSRSELIRRERLRKELQNEDALQERLEGLRLQNELGISDKILGSKDVQAVAPAVAESKPLEQEVVSSDLVVNSASTSVSAPAPVVSQAQQSVEMAAPAMVNASSTSDESASSEESVRLAITPRLGLSNMANSYGYVIEPRYTAGLDLGVAVSDHVRFDVGYAFSEYGVSLASSNPWVWGFQNYTGTREPLAMKQNVVDAGLKLYVLGEDSRLRPYLGGGGAYSKSFINYDQRIINALYSSGLQSLAADYTLDSFLGFVTGGMDVRLTRGIAVGVNARYYAVLSSRENQSLNNAAIAGYYPGYYGYGSYYSADADKQILGGTMSRAAFYSVTGDVTFSF